MKKVLLNAVNQENLANDQSRRKKGSKERVETFEKTPKQWLTKQ